MDIKVRESGCEARHPKQDTTCYQPQRDAEREDVHDKLASSAIHKLSPSSFSMERNISDNRNCHGGDMDDRYEDGVLCNTTF